MKKLVIPMFILMVCVLSGSFIYAALPEYQLKSNSTQIVGTLQVNFNGSDKIYTTIVAFDNKPLGDWSVILENRGEHIYISLPSDIKSGDEFSKEDGQISAYSVGPPSFCFSYQDRNGNNYSLADAYCFDAFGLIIDKWGGRGGYAEGRFAAELRPIIGDTIIMKKGRFKIKIRN